MALRRSLSAGLPNAGKFLRAAFSLEVLRRRFALGGGPRFALAGSGPLRFDRYPSHFSFPHNLWFYFQRQKRSPPPPPRPQHTTPDKRISVRKVPLRTAGPAPLIFLYGSSIAYSSWIARENAAPLASFQKNFYTLYIDKPAASCYYANADDLLRRNERAVPSSRRAIGRSFVCLRADERQAPCARV